jgi:hypothetical protein
MSQPSPRSEPHAAPPTLHVRALDSVRYIRETMEQAAAFTAVPGWGMVWIGSTALVAAWIAARQPQPSGWIAVWCGEGLLAIAIAAVTIRAKLRARDVPMFSSPNRRFFASLVVPLLAGAVLTSVLLRHGLGGELPGTWLLLYGTAVFAGGTLSVRIVPVMGMCFMALGAATLLVPGIPRDAAMAAGFGGLHVIFGSLIARRHGG